jgi:hypothetical protein
MLDFSFLVRLGFSISFSTRVLASLITSSLSDISKCFRNNLSSSALASAGTNHSFQIRPVL